MKLDPPPVQMAVDEGQRVLSMPWLRWFQSLYSVVQALLGTKGGANVNTVYGQFQSTATQTIATANTVQIIALNTSVLANGVSLASNKVTVAYAGVYSFSFQVQLSNPDTSINEIFVWMRKNGADVAATGDKYSVAAKHGTVDGYAVLASTMYLTLAAGDYIEFYMAATSNLVNLEAYAASTSPFNMPSIPSVDVNVVFVST
jgi:hypothetical protein